MLRQRTLIVVVTFLYLSFSMLAKGQELAATLNGRATDPSGATLAGASVVITQNGVNGASRTVQTDANGNFTATNLAAGTYTVTVTAAGFQTYTAENVVLNVAQTRSVEARLKVGGGKETVTVQESNVNIDTATSALAGTISGTQVKELQLNNRNFEQLVTLQPGVVSALPDEVGFGLNNTSSVAVNGVRDTANNWTVDGADINDSGSNATLLNVPSVDAIQEFTLERSTYDAGFGRSAGGQVLVATKSGTSAFHGDAYEFARNDVFNANSYFNKNITPVIPRAIQRYNNYGFTIGGPLYIPKVFNTSKDKLFFFWSEEWRKVSAPVTSSVTAPSAAQLNGTFSGQITDAPSGCVAYDVNTNTSTLNSGCYSQNARIYLTNLYDKFPANSGDQYVSSYSQQENTREDLVRLDYNINDKLHFFGRAMQDETPQNFPQGLFSGENFPGVAGATVNAPGENVVGNLTWTISPRMVNEAEFAYSQGTISSQFTPGAIADSSTVSGGLTNNTAYNDPYGRIPVITFVGGDSTLQGFNLGSTPYFERNLDRTLFDNFSVTIGRHTLRAGATISQMLKTENASSGAPSFQFANFSDFLLGNVRTYSQSSRDTIPDLHYVNYEAFVQDDWKLTDRLTLNFGLRYSYFPSPGDVLNTLNNFDPSLFNAANAPTIDPVSGNFAAGGQIPATYVNGLIFPTGSACSSAQAIAPAVTCSPWGAHVNPDPKKNFAPRLGFAMDVFGNGKTSFRGGYGIFFDRMLNGIWEQNAFQDPPLVQTATINGTQFDHPLAGSSAVSLGPNHLVSTGSPMMPNPYYQDFNLGVQQQLQPGTVLEIGYVAALGRKLLGERELNQPTLSARAANPNAYVTAVVPYAGYSWFASRIPAYTSNYHSLQVALQHHSHGLTLGVAYTWSKTLANQSNDRDTETYDTYNPNIDYGPTTLNQPHTFVANYVYELPFYHEQHGLVGHVLGGWQLSGITEFNSGQSLTVRQSSDNFDCQTPFGATTGCIAGTYPGGLNMDVADIAPRPDRIARMQTPKKVTEWFSPASFADAIGHFGNSSNGNLLGPGIELWDLSAIKNNKITERFSFQFRAEFFNAFNHTNFDAVTVNIDSASAGQVTSTHDPRQIQLGGKLYF
jgi:Carboxypeptidase regulatory-like domain/TonB-dependent Receptor Plug Domain